MTIPNSPQTPTTPPAEADAEAQTAVAMAVGRGALASSFSALPGTARIEAARRACEACGGAIIAPSLPWGPQEHEITLLGVMASGPTEHAAIAEWIKAAQRCAEGLAA